MSKDRYSDSHIIEVLQDNDFLVTAAGHSSFRVYKDSATTEDNVWIDSDNVDIDALSNIRLDASNDLFLEAESALEVKSNGGTINIVAGPEQNIDGTTPVVNEYGLQVGGNQHTGAINVISSDDIIVQAYDSIFMTTGGYSGTGASPGVWVDGYSSAEPVMTIRYEQTDWNIPEWPVDDPMFRVNYDNEAIFRVYPNGDLKINPHSTHYSNGGGVLDCGGIKVDTAAATTGYVLSAQDNAGTAEWVDVTTLFSTSSMSGTSLTLEASGGTCTDDSILISSDFGGINIHAGDASSGVAANTSSSYCKNINIRSDHGATIMGASVVGIWTDTNGGFDWDESPSTSNMDVTATSLYTSWDVENASEDAGGIMGVHSTPVYRGPDMNAVHGMIVEKATGQVVIKACGVGTSAEEYRSGVYPPIILDGQKYDASVPAILLMCSNDGDDSGGSTTVEIEHRTDTGSAASNDVYIAFTNYSDKFSSPAGRIRCAGGDAPAAAFITDYQTGSSSDDWGGLSTADDWQTINADAVLTSGQHGHCVFASGNADYGEWLEAGDLEEWGMSEDKRFEHAINNRGRLGVQEGVIVYARGGRFYRSSPGTPMAITSRAIVVGNERGRPEGWLGEIVSFMGQVPVLVKGPIEVGDLLVADGEHYCVGISQNDATLGDLMRSIGTSWTRNSQLPHVVGKTLAAIGVKSYVY